MPQQYETVVSDAGYQVELEPPHDVMITTRAVAPRNTGVRAITAIVASFAIVLIPTLFLGYWGYVFKSETWTRILGTVGFAVGVILLMNIAPRRLFIYVPEWMGYVTQEALSGTMVPYGPGLHTSHFTEVRNKKGNWSLKVIAREFTISIQTEDATAIMTTEYGYAVHLPVIERAIGMHDDSAVDGSIQGFIGSFLTHDLADEKVDKVLGMARELNTKLKNEFQRATVDNPATRVDERTLEKISEKYGIKIVYVVVKNIGLTKAVQETREGIDKGAQLFEVMAQIAGEINGVALREKVKTGDITKKELDGLRNRALALTNNAKMEIKVIEGELPAAVADAVTGGSNNRGGQQ